MILINKDRSYPIIHKHYPGRQGQPMTEQEIHEFGIELLIVYLYKQKGNLISANHNRLSEYPNLVVKNPDNKLLYVWIETKISPNIPFYNEDEHHKEKQDLANKFNAIPVFAGIVLSGYPSDENFIPLCGGKYIAEFTGFKAIYIG